MSAADAAWIRERAGSAMSAWKRWRKRPTESASCPGRRPQRKNRRRLMAEVYRAFDFADEAAWKKGRLRGIGGSDAAAVVGRNPYKSNIDLFEEKTGLCTPEDISGKDYVIYGHRAEPLIRGLFALDYPEYQVEYHEWRILQSVRWPFMQASLDGELTDSAGRRGILEIKTSNIQQSMQRGKWENRIPDNYYIQALHYLLVTGYDFAVLRAHLVSQWGDDIRTQAKHYFIERSEVQEDLDYLLAGEKRFWEYVETGKRPPLVLPEI